MTNTPGLCKHKAISIECPDCLVEAVDEGLHWSYLTPRAERVRDLVRGLQAMNRLLMRKLREAEDR